MGKSKVHIVWTFGAPSYGNCAVLTACLWSAYPKGTIEWQFTYLKRTILSSQFLGLNQGNWAKFMTFDPPILKEIYHCVNFLGWSRVIWQNVWLSIHLFSQEPYYQVNFLGLRQGNWAKCVTVNSPIYRLSSSWSRLSSSWSRWLSSWSRLSSSWSRSLSSWSHSSSSWRGLLGWSCCSSSWWSLMGKSKVHVVWTFGAPS